MNPVAFADAVSWIGITIAIKEWKRALTRDVKIILFFLFLLIFFHNWGNTLEWADITTFFDPIEDMLEVLEALMWIFFFYIFLRDLDLSERLKIEKSLRESELTLRTIFDNAMDGILVVDAESKKFLTCNKRICQMLGYTMDEIKALGVMDIHPEKDLSYVIDQFKGQARGEFTLARNIPMKRRDGSIFYTDINSSPVAIKGRQYLIGMIRDITEQKEAEARIKQYLSSLEVLNTMIKDVTSTLDIREVLAKVARYAADVTGADASSIAIYDEEKEIMTYPYHYNMPSTLSNVIATKGKGLAEYTMLKRESMVIEDYPSHPRALKEFVDAGIKVLAAVPLISKGRAFGAIGVFGLTRDKRFTTYQLELLEAVGREAAIAIENARLFENLRRLSVSLEEKVRERTREIENANIKLRELDRLKSMFIASMSHELRTPLNSIIGFTGVILQGLTGKISDEQRDQLQRVYDSARHLLALINDVIDVSRIEAGKVRAYVEEFYLDGVIKEAISNLKHEIEDKGIAIELNLPKGIRLRTDRRRLFQCILNYIGNAVKFTEKGSVRIEAREIEESIIEISVFDTGIGIKKEDIPKLFIPFIRLETPMKARTKGTGLGLYLTKKLAEEVLRGSVSVKSEYGKGSIFSIKIPKELNKEGQ
jgi:PAS domain S-box-containing protein